MSVGSRNSLCCTQLSRIDNGMLSISNGLAVYTDYFEKLFI